MRRRALTVFLMVFLVLGPRLVRAQNCATSDLVGSYTWSVNGVLIPGLGVPGGPFARLGRVTLDGNGNVLIDKITASYNGVIENTVFAGKYAVNPDCTTKEVIFAPPPINAFIPVASVIINGRKGATALAAIPVPGVTAKATLAKQSPDLKFLHGACANDSFQGQFGIDLSGDIAMPPGKFIRVGTLTSPGDGTFTANTVADYDGATIQAETFSETYTVDTDCFVTMNYTATTPMGSQTGNMLALMADRNNAKVLVTTPGFIVYGTFTRQ